MQEGTGQVNAASKQLGSVRGGGGGLTEMPTGGFNLLLAGMFLRAHFTAAAAEACPLD